MTLKFKNQENTFSCTIHKPSATTTLKRGFFSLNPWNICENFHSSLNKSVSNSNKTIFVGSLNTLSDGEPKTQKSNLLSVKNANLPSSSGHKQSTSSRTINSVKITDGSYTGGENKQDCIYCMTENKNSIDEFGGLLTSRERLYNQQPYLMFKYHIFMCFLIFITVAVVLLITDLRK